MTNVVELPSDDPPSKWNESVEEFTDDALQQMRANWEGLKAEVAANLEHNGDCTKVARSCLVCMLENHVTLAKRLRPQ